MKVFILNGHAPVAGVAEGKLASTMVGLAEEFFKTQGAEIKKTAVSEQNWDVEEEIQKYEWADVIFFHTPAYWFGLPWVFKKYVDEVYTVGMMGRMCKGDGRHRATPHDDYGTAGCLKGKYMLSLTMNAPSGAFGRPDQWLLKGANVDDEWSTFHNTQRFCGLTQIPDSTFVCHDVMKNPTIKEDMERFQEHMTNLFKEE